MRKTKKIFGVIVPLVMVAILAFGVVATKGATNSNEPLKTLRAEDTGASSADTSQKGGSIFLEEGATFIMNGGTIDGSKNTYGGAVYVSNKATFTMNGGTIQNCQAKFGGAIYIASGGRVTIGAGKILSNTAPNAPSIYVEPGGMLTLNQESQVEGNIIGEWFGDWFPYTIGPEETMGGTYAGVESSVKLRTIYFGSYPQSYVGDEMNATLESWYSDQEELQPYTIRDIVWKAYRYIDGQTYVRGQGAVYDGKYTYKDGTTVRVGYSTQYTWFKVEPIKWYVLNYDAWRAGREKMELLSELVLTSYVRYNAESTDGNNWADSEMQLWLNGDFYKSAFTISEQQDIIVTENLNNVTNEYNKEPYEWTGTTTQDKVYLMSYYDMGNDLFVGNVKEGNGYSARMCSPSDFALNNNCYLNNTYSTNYRKGTTHWWLRSAGSNTIHACYVFNYGSLATNYGVRGDYRGVRPALRLNISAQ